MPGERQELFYHRARVTLPTPERMAQIRSLVGDRFAEDAIYPWDAEISNTLLDSHFTHMSESTLRNYVEDANNGVAFLRGHNWHELPVGYSIEASLGEESGRKRVMAGFYTVRGIPDADDLILRMEAKILRDVSVGFYGGRAVCDLCGQDFWDCRHFPGLKYETKDGDTVKTELATFTIEDARLSEVSGVFDGSTPQAMIRKAQTFAAQGLLEPKQIEVLEQRYRVRLAAKRSFSVPQPKERRMEEKDLERIRSIFVDLELMTTEEARSLEESKLAASVEFLAQMIRNMNQQAADGRQYRTDLITEALEQGVRAHGNSFDKEGYQALLEGAPLDSIKRFASDWKRVADAALPTGRHSTDGEEQPAPRISLVPDEAYQ